MELVTAILGAAGKSLATKAVTGPTEKLARKALASLDAQPLGEAAVAVRKAVEAARKDLIGVYWKEEDALGRDVVTLLEHPPFAEEVARRLLFRGQPDFDRLHRFYLDLDESADPAAASERWQALRTPLEVFFETIEQHLQADPLLGPVLRDSRLLATSMRLVEGQEIVAEVSRDIRRYQRRTARAAESSDASLEELVARTGDQTVFLGQILELLRAVLGDGGKTGDGEGTQESLAPAEASYLRLLREDCNRLPLADDPRDVSAKQEKRPQLANVYVDLATRTEATAAVIFARLGVPEDERAGVLERLSAGVEGGEDGERRGPEALLHAGQLLKTGGGEIADDHPLRPWAKDTQTLAAASVPLTALEALARNRHLVLLGDPGSGKSTLVNHLAASLADKLLGDDDAPLETPSGTFEERLFPIRITLRRWSARLTREAVEDGREMRLVYAALDDLPGDVDRGRWKQRFDDSSTLVLFDGLDEVPAAAGEDGPERGFDRRRCIVAAVEAFRTAHPCCRVLVTCRVKPYREGRHQLAELPTFELAPLDEGRVRRFCERWYDEMAAVGRLRADEAGERRERLLRAFGQRPVLREMAGTPLLLTMLAKVNARAVLPESRAELYGECIEQLLWEWESQKSKGGVESLAGLLDEPGASLERADFERVLWRLTYEAHGGSGKDGIADLPADALRPALAAIHPRRHQGWAWAERVLDLMRERGGLLIESDEDVFTFPHRSFQEYLACRWLLEQDNAAVTARELAGDDIWSEVVQLSCGYLKTAGHFSDLQAIVGELVAGGPPGAAGDWQRILIAGRAWRDFGPHRAVGGTGEELKTKLPDLSTRLMQHLDLPAAQRLEAGLIAADLGALPDDLDEWVEIPADSLEYAFKIGKYPVANHQYRRFVDDGGYERDRGWFSDEAQREILEVWGKWPDGPGLENNPAYNRATQPVVGISWWEAAAYAAWLTVRLRKAGEIGEQDVVRLAKLAEWQRAAGGTEGRKYSWDGDFDPRRTNSEENGLGQPTPVHMYPAGATSEGVFDLTGNVWEWCEKGGSASIDVAGGAWYNDADGVGAAARSRYGRYFGAVNLGFRVVFVPISRA